jgi:hypothetical protein
MRRPLTVALLAVGAVLGAACSDDDGAADDGSAEPEVTTTEAPDELYPDHEPDLYAGTDNWICHPELDDDPCRDIEGTVIDPAGERSNDGLEPADEPAFDCFYAYPTTSMDPGPNSDLEADDSEITTVVAQVARYSSVCRVFAPVYRSRTLPALAGGESDPATREMAYGDVFDAWQTYVDGPGAGRPVVLIGHSQGAGILRALVADELAPDPAVRERIIAAVLMGTSVSAEEGLPPCTSTDEAGCLVSFSTFAADQPPPADAFFGRLEDGPAVCTDPVALTGGDGGDDLAGTVVPVTTRLLGRVEGFEDVETPFVVLPDVLTAECVITDTHGYLAVAPADPTGSADVRATDGLLVQSLGPTWGLHLFDANLVQTDLIELVSLLAEAHAQD